MIPVLLLTDFLISQSAYEFHLSEGHNFLDRNDSGKAILHYKKAVQKNPEAADAFLQLGHIHLRQDLLKTALEYFKQAESYLYAFQHPRSEIKLYMNMAATYNKLRFVNQEILYLNKIISASKQQEGNFYKRYSGKSFFLLGLIAMKRSEKLQSNQFFRKAIAHGFWEKANYLYLANFYALHTQRALDALKKQSDPEKSEKEDRNRFFKFYYQKYLGIPPESDEDSYLSQEKIKKMIRETEEYFYSLPDADH